MSTQRSPNTLSEWLELDYFRRPRRLKALWRPIVLATLVIGVLTMVTVAALQKRLVPGLAKTYQAGPLSSSHALFNNDCGKCHTEAFRTWDRLWQFNPAIRAVSDTTCSSCHAGPAHHPGKVGEGTPNCAACHREHHGQTPLARVPDGYCIGCHRDLPSVVKPGQETLFQNIASFAAHPEFAHRWQGAPHDPGTVAFNHAVHLDPEGILTAENKQSKTLGATPASEDRRARRKVLQCGDCHIPDEAGRTMRPVRYDRHCQECHPLTVGIVSTRIPAEASKALAEFNRIPAPHQSPEVVRATLRDRLTQFIQQNAGFLQADLRTDPPPRPIPGTRPSRPELVTREEHEWIGKQLIEVEKPLFNSRTGCAYCHQEIKPQERKGGQLPVYAPSQINERTFAGIGATAQWFPHSRFRHDSHRMLDCTRCHDARSSRLTSDVLLPGIDTCRTCHNRSGASARNDCAACHTYHPRTNKP